MLVRRAMDFLSDKGVSVERVFGASHSGMAVVASRPKLADFEHSDKKTGNQSTAVRSVSRFLATLDVSGCDITDAKVQVSFYSSELVDKFLKSPLMSP
eukprot:2598767-Amphidinium_carterae.1